MEGGGPAPGRPRPLPAGSRLSGSAHCPLCPVLFLGLPNLLLGPKGRIGKQLGAAVPEALCKPRAPSRSLQDPEPKDPSSLALRLQNTAPSGEKQYCSPLDSLRRLASAFHKYPTLPWACSVKEN